MLHDVLNPKDWQKHFKIFDSLYIEGLSGRFLIKKSRVNSAKGLNDVLRAIQKVQTLHKNWKTRVWQPIFNSLIQSAKDGKIICHAKHPNGKFWEYEISREECFGNQFCWTHKWKDAVEAPQLLELGQKFFEANNFEARFTSRLYILSEILKGFLKSFINDKYDARWLKTNQFSEKIVKINLRGEQFWFRVVRGKHGFPTWELFIFQSANLEEINL